MALARQQATASPSPVALAALAHRLFQGRQRNRFDDGLMVMEEAAPKRATRQQDRQNGDHTHY